MFTTKEFFTVKTLLRGLYEVGLLEKVNRNYYQYQNLSQPHLTSLSGHGKYIWFFAISRTPVKHAFINW